MVQVLEKTDIEKIKIVDSEDIGEIKSALDSILYVPNVQIRQRIIEELCRYLQSKLKFDCHLYPLQLYLSQIIPV